MQHIRNLFETEHNVTNAINRKADGLMRTNKRSSCRRDFTLRSSKSEKLGMKLFPLPHSLNTAKQEMICYSPFELVCGRQPIAPIDAALHFNVSSQRSQLSDHQHQKVLAEAEAEAEEEECTSSACRETEAIFCTN